MEPKRIAVIPGDGIGKEVVPEGMRVLEAAAARFKFSLQWDEFDWSTQPFDHTTYDGRALRGICGAEHLSRITTTSPDGEVTVGAGQTELFIDGAYLPYGFTG